MLFRGGKRFFKNAQPPLDDYNARAAPSVRRSPPGQRKMMTSALPKSRSLLCLRCWPSRRKCCGATSTARRCDTMAPRLRSAVVRFNALPALVWRVIMLALPVDARARAACVCRSWRAFLADVSLWQVLDLTPAGGVAAERVAENLVRGAVARAAGQRACLRYDYRGPAASSQARLILRLTQALR